MVQRVGKEGHPVANLKLLERAEPVDVLTAPLRMFVCLLPVALPDVIFGHGIVCLPGCTACGVCLCHEVKVVQLKLLVGFHLAIPLHKTADYAQPCGSGAIVVRLDIFGKVFLYFVHQRQGLFFKHAHHPVEKLLALAVFGSLF